MKTLVDEGILTTAPATDGSAYREYLLTEKGEQLYLVLVALWQWGEKYSFEPGEQEIQMVDRKNQEPLAPLELRARDGRLIGPRDYTGLRDAVGEE